MQAIDQDTASFFGTYRTGNRPEPRKCSIAWAIASPRSWPNSHPHTPLPRCEESATKGIAKTSPPREPPAMSLWLQIAPSQFTSVSRQAYTSCSENRRQAHMQLTQTLPIPCANPTPCVLAGGTLRAVSQTRQATRISRRNHKERGLTLQIPNTVKDATARNGLRRTEKKRACIIPTQAR